MSPLPRVALSICCGLGALDFLSLSLRFSPGSLTSLYFSLTLPLYSIFSSFIPLYFATQPTTFLSLSELLQHSQRCCSRAASGAISDAVRHMEECCAPKLGGFTSAAKYQRCITDRDVMGLRWICRRWHKALATEEVVLYKDGTQSHRASAALYSLSQ